MRISFFGAAGEVTGSCYLLETAAKKLLVDCGMFQGTYMAEARNHDPLPFDAPSIDAILVTHAHLDHTGRIPKLVNAGFRGKIYATKPTIALTKIIWDDALEVMNYDAEKTGGEPVFTKQDIEKAETFFQDIDYGKSIDLGNGVQATWHDAGHILGSSFIEVNAEGKRIVFSGDLGNRDVPILRPTEKLPETTVLVMESTYGAHIHHDPATRTNLLRAAIIRTIKGNGVLLIPAFALERIQEILYELDTLVEKNLIPRVPIFLDSPLAIKATQIFRDYPSYYNREAMQRVSHGDDFFTFPGLKMTLTRDESRTINDAPQPKVIIAGAGMMTGGRILHHLRRYLKDRNSLVLIVGYQAIHTLGRKLLDGEREVLIYGERVPVRAQIEKIGGYSAHADREGLISWVRSSPQLPKRIFITHGEDDSRAMLAADLQKIGIKAELPTLNSQFKI